ncbi:hypothetical protein EBB59_01475 [Lysobacter pythonis]|uniref:Uncharacterized protein n=1 Tax=Solilutibacter pythonis TaxID=2483112 RepID=A0A3M2I1X6_9GAMM|nr:hypothetical protein [Lysobacter pythonis]RMH94395.1 hypothetical protein EBB59_01475 [Lysobacter pythonis]
MHILGPGRDAFLEFLRNLTPQALLFSAAIVVLSQIKPPVLAMANAGRALLVLGLLSIALLAAHANVGKFLDNAFSGSSRARKTTRRIKRMEPAFRRRFLLLLIAGWRYRRISFLEFFVAVAVVYSCLVAVLLMAVYNVLKLLGMR